MKIREGAYYRARNGQLIGPMKINSDEPDRPWHDDAMMTWPDNGKYDDEPDLKTDRDWGGFDLISEVYVSDTPPDAPETKTLRDEFAMEAMKLLFPKHGADWVKVMLAIDAYKQADAMMEAREK